MNLIAIKVTKEAKQMLLNEKLVGETYSDTLKRVIGNYNAFKYKLQYLEEEE